jgi:hypothetical protein
VYTRTAKTVAQHNNKNNNTREIHTMRTARKPLANIETNAEIGEVKPKS